ncbi:hypothetical protein [Dysosmobacter welbionis]|uniref:hypothetical protein n=1 Tax=Dysosmobacter welbionis TaxID=2093857 RepID=UPI003AB2D990
MYRIVKDGTELALIEAPSYVRQARNGCFVLCQEAEAAGIAYNGTVYHLLGREVLEGAESVILEVADAGVEIQAARESAAQSAKLSGQLSAAARLYVQAATDVPDETALEMPDLFKTWEEALKAGKELPKDTIINDGGQLYRVVQAVTPQKHQPPHGEGMLAIYRPIDQTHAGTKEDPIPWVYGMDTEQSKYYSYGGKTYLCNLTMPACVWAPGTPGMWQWSEVTE